MAIMQWRPFREFDSLRQQMDRLFDDMLHSEHSWGSDRDWGPMLSMGNDVAWRPSIELKDSDGALLVKAQLPGINPEDLEIEVSPTRLSIHGELREETETEAGDTYRSEFRYGTFERVIPLPVPIQYDAVTSHFEDGILTLTLPKDEQALPKSVKVDVTRH